MNTIIFPRQTQSILATSSGVLVSGDQLAEIIVPTSGLYLCGFDTWGATGITAPRAIELLLERQLPTPLQSFKLALGGVDTAGKGSSWRGRLLLRGQALQGASVAEQWSFLVRLRTALPLGETVHTQLTLTLLAAVLGTSASQERLNTMELEELHRLKVLS